MQFAPILIPAAIIVGLLIFIGLIMARLYKRATREMSLVTVSYTHLTLPTIYSV